MEGLKFEMSAVCADRVLSPRAARMKIVSVRYSVSQRRQSQKQKDCDDDCGVSFIHRRDDDVL
jgi:hypothetical protein